MGFVSDVVSNSLPWLCRAVEILKNSAQHSWIKEANWGQVSSKLEFGVDSDWALAAIRASCPSARTILAPFGRAAENQASTDRLFPSGYTGSLAREWLITVGGHVGNWDFGKINANELTLLMDWMNQRIPGIDPDE